MEEKAKRKPVQKDKSKIYLNSLAKEHGMTLNAYVDLMRQYDAYFFEKYQFTVCELKGKPLEKWIVHLFRELNPTDFEINTMKEEGRFVQWLGFISEIRKIKK